jgi:CDP-glycerol glycerophosphotransferase (TagB/SpsB family)
MKIGFFIWNGFMFHHLKPIYKHFVDAEYLISDRGENRQEVRELLDYFDNAEVRYRKIKESDFSSLDKNFDCYISTFFPLSVQPILKPFVIIQYGMSKEKNQFDFRWSNADIKLVYGEYSRLRIDANKYVYKVGNPRFDDFFNDNISSIAFEMIKSSLNPNKRTICYSPTWGDLTSTSIFANSIDQLSNEFNIIYNPHHLLNRNDINYQLIAAHSVFVTTSLPIQYDSAPIIYKLADCVVSDYSGAIFDALHCELPVLCIKHKDLDRHKKTTEFSLENRLVATWNPVDTSYSLVEAIALEMSKKIS